jgi:protein involved in polysaccharide export with SLBB domain
VVVRRILIAGLLLLALWPAGVFAQAESHVSPDTPLDRIDWGQVPEYRIVPGDELTLDFGPREDFTGNVYHVSLVRPDGRITLYPVGDVVAAGRTAQELQANIRQLLAGELREPRITVEVSKPTANRIHVLGRVKRPGSQVVGVLPTLLQAIGDAGGFEDDAARNSVVIMRRVGVGTVSVARVNVGRLLHRGGDVPLGRFDIVYVPRSAIGNLDVFVTQFFGPASLIGSTSMTGWELFHLNTVFQLGRTTVR